MDLPPHLRRLAASQDGVLVWRQLAAAGLHPSVARREVHAGRWVRLRRGAYLVDARTSRAGSPWVQARAVHLAHPEAVLAGTTAAALWGMEQVPSGPAEVVLPPRRAVSSRPDLLPHVWSLTRDDTTVLRGMRLTTRSRTVLDLVCRLDRLTSLAVLDAALRHGHVVTAELPEMARRAAGRPGAAMKADLWRLADARAESALESRVRLRCIEGGVPPDDLQVEIRSRDGELLARVDMVMRARSRGRSGLLLVEADGAAVHASPDALHRDRVRSNRLTTVGHDILRFTWRDTLDPWTIPSAIRAAQ